MNGERAQTRRKKNGGQQWRRGILAALAVVFCLAGFANQTAAGQDKVLYIQMDFDEEQFQKSLAGRTDWEEVYFFNEPADSWVETVAAFPELRRITFNLSGGLIGRTTGRPPLSPAALAKLAECPKLERLLFQHNLPDDRATAYLPAFRAIIEKCPTLHSFYLFSYANDDGLGAGLLTKPVPSPTLRNLAINGPALGIGDDTLAALAKAYPALRFLNVVNTVFRHGEMNAQKNVVGPRGLAALSNCPDLRGLSLDARVEGEGALAALVRACPDLSSLKLTNRDNIWNEADIQALRGLEKLQTLALAMAPPTPPAVWAALGELSTVNDLDLHRADSLTDADLATVIKKMPLTRLQLLSTLKLTDAALAAIGEKDKLDFLMIFGHTKIGDEGIMRLGGIPGLKTLIFAAATAPTDQSLLFIAERFPNLQHLDLAAATAPTDAGLLALAKLPNLQHIDLRAATAITEAGENAFKERIGEQRRFNLRTARRMAAANQNHGRPAAAPNTLYLPSDCTDGQFAMLLGERRDWTAVESRAYALTDAWMEKIAELPELKTFTNLNSSPHGLTERGMALLARNTKLQRVEICSANHLTDKAFAAIFEGCPELEYFRSCDSPPDALTDAGLAAVGRATKLREVQIRAVADGAGDALFRALAENCPAFEKLVLSENPVTVTNEGLAALAKLPALHTLFLKLVPGEHKTALAALGEAPALRYLLVAGTPVDDEVMAGLARSESLVDVHLTIAGAVTDDGLAAIAATPTLTRLSLRGARQITDAGVARLAAVAKFTRLVIEGAPLLSDASLLALADVSPLRTLMLSAARFVTDEGVVELARLPELSELILTDATDVGDDALAALAERGKIVELDLNAARKVTDAGVLALAGGCKETLRILRLNSAGEIGDAVLDPLADCPGLRQLYLGGARRLTQEAVRDFRRKRRNVQLHVPAHRHELPPPPDREIELF